MFWNELSPSARSRLEGVGTVTTHRRCGTVFTEGEPSTYVLVVLSGTIKLTKTTLDGRDVLIELRRSGDLIGELAAMDGQPRSASAHAVSDLSILVITAERFRAAVAADPEIAAALIRTLAERVRQAADRRIEAAANTALARVGSRLHELATEQAPSADGSVKLTALTQQELADWIGLSRERVAHALRDLRALGWIDTSRRSVTIVDPAALREVAADTR